jgi:hypothetical protein
MLVKLLAAETILVTAAATGLDGTAERIAIYGAAGAALAWFGARIVRLTKAVENLNDIPALKRDARENRSALIAICRELGIEFRTIAHRDDDE